MGRSVGPRLALIHAGACWAGTQTLTWHSAVDMQFCVTASIGDRDQVVDSSPVDRRGGGTQTARKFKPSARELRCSFP
jgi:hypothetical protein